MSEKSWTSLWSTFLCCIRWRDRVVKINKRQWRESQAIGRSTTLSRLLKVSLTFKNVERMFMSLNKYYLLNIWLQVLVTPNKVENKKRRVLQNVNSDRYTKRTEGQYTCSSFKSKHSHNRWQHGKWDWPIEAIGNNGVERRVADTCRAYKDSNFVYLLGVKHSNWFNGFLVFYYDSNM